LLLQGFYSVRSERLWCERLRIRHRALMRAARLQREFALWISVPMPLNDIG